MLAAYRHARIHARTMTNMGASLEGAEMTTFLAPPFRCSLACGWGAGGAQCGEGVVSWRCQLCQVSLKPCLPALVPCPAAAGQMQQAFSNPPTNPPTS